MKFSKKRLKNSVKETKEQSNFPYSISEMAVLAQKWNQKGKNVNLESNNLMDFIDINEVEDETFSYIVNVLKKQFRGEDLP